MSDTPVGVIGAGSFGTTIAQLLATRTPARTVLLYARSREQVNEINRTRQNRRFFEAVLAPNIRATDDLAALARDAALLFAVLPSQAMRPAMAALAPWASAEHMIVHAAKGLEKGTFKTMSRVICEETCVRRVGALSGPNLAREIIEGKPSATVIGSKFSEVAEAVAGALATPFFLVYANHDILGVELGGALKNVLAIGAGVVDGAELGVNAKSLLLTRGLAEMAGVAAHMGADPQTFTGLAGVGDVIATCHSPLSRNYQLGFRLGRGEKTDAVLRALDGTVEGPGTVATLSRYAKAHGLTLNITEGLHQLLFEEKTLGDVRALIMSKHAAYEIDRRS